jgi:phage shock protein A
MALMERVATLIRANINDLLDKAEDPEKMLKQVIVDMQNQLLQVKTQVAIAIADQHLLLKKQQEHKDNAEKWMKKAELAVGKKEDDLARAAIERSMTSRAMAESFAQQVEDQRVQVENLKSALQKLTHKLEDPASARARVEQGGRCATRGGRVGRRGVGFGAGEGPDLGCGGAGEGGAGG